MGDSAPWTLGIRRCPDVRAGGPFGVRSAAGGDDVWRHVAGAVPDGKVSGSQRSPGDNDGEAPERSIDVELAIKLKEENKAFKVEKYKHSYPNCWRTDKPILYYPLDSWFIKVTDVKDRMHELNKTINWKPKSTGEGRFGNWLANANDWNLSRSRYWGIPLPIWRTEDGTEEICIGSVGELKSEMAKAVSAGVLSKDIFEDFEVGI